MIPDSGDQPNWIYADATRKVNQYPTADKPITSIANTANKAFNSRLNDWQTLLQKQNAKAFLTNANDFRGTAGPAGENGALTQFNELFVNQDRQNVWSNPTEFASTRPACDPRLEETAKKCFKDAFNNDRDFVDGNFCVHIPGFNGYVLNDVNQKQIDSDSGSAIPNQLSTEAQISVEVKDSIIANLVLLIESDLIDGSTSALNNHIPPGAYTFTRAAKRVCDPKCPVPSDWSPWTCHCPKSGDANPDNLVDCRCGSQTRSRIQTCTNVEGVTCNIYHDGLKPFVNNAPNFAAAASEYNTCKAYGYGQYLDNGLDPVYRPVAQSLKTVIDYDVGSSVDDLMKWYPGRNQDSPCTKDLVVTENTFRQYLEDPSRNDFSFAREDDTCAATNTEVKVVETQCDKSCGCGTYTKTYTCFYKGGDQDGEAVPVDSEDYSCSCPKNKGKVTIDMPLQCYLSLRLPVSLVTF